MIKNNNNLSIIQSIAEQMAFVEKIAQPGALSTAIVKKAASSASLADVVAQQAAFAARFAQSGALSTAIVKKAVSSASLANVVAQQTAFAARFAQPGALSTAIVKNAVAQQIDFVKKVAQRMTLSEQIKYCSTLQDILVSVTPDLPESDEINNNLNDDSLQEIDTGDIQLSYQEKQEISETLKDVIEQNANWEQKLIDRLKIYKESHPVIYRILVFILGTVLVPIIINYCSNLINLKSEPSPKAEIVIVVPADQVRIINESKNYYYEVEYFDEETQEFRTAWIGKGKLKSIIK